MKLSYFFLIALTFSLFTECRKGENDPFLSLRTRKVRVTGFWKLDAGTYSYFSPNIMDLLIEYDGKKATEKLSGRIIETYNYSIEFKINKDYSFERIIIENGFSKIEKGAWFFNKKSRELELKNKEAITLSILSIESSGIKTSYTGARADEIWLIDKLKNNELILRKENTFTTSTTDTEIYEMNYLKY